MTAGVRFLLALPDTARIDDANTVSPVPVTDPEWDQSAVLISSESDRSG